MNSLKKEFNLLNKSLINNLEATLEKNVDPEIMSTVRLATTGLLTTELKNRIFDTIVGSEHSMR